ncbi:translation elongation factor Ts [Chthoniobacter flavus Ellin428]|uniref:Elongation factor Ts n=1 Tax=Chthoniobacter flavus Ellin428 TaxID=497964 RepID=B4D1W9_9BACT|nr:translation elongation factor Ts [Chthoniobacter flavus]EDY19731.1 translation elongation factor Ts [Chthoniobacter flavus Ellin428]TCO92966.1 elongation factor Ts [Chthoniobacter flavus]
MSTATVIDAQLVKTLREKTNAGLMECKKALAETNGDVEAAVDVLRKKGTIKAGEKSDREAKEGVIAQAILPGAKVGVLVEVNCETDFVAKNDSFKAFTDDIAKKIALDPKTDLEADRIEAFQKLKENLVIRRHERVEVTGPGAVAAYIHTGGKVGVLVEVGAKKEETSTTEIFKQLVRDITLQIAAAHPISVDRTSVPAATVERERAIYVEQVPAGKPANIVENIVKGKLDKFFSTVCLVDQAFIKNPDQTITQLVAEKSKELGDELVIRRFLRFSVGEQIA